MKTKQGFLSSHRQAAVLENRIDTYFQKRPYPLLQLWRAPQNTVFDRALPQQEYYEYTLYVGMNVPRSTLSLFMIIQFET